MKKFISIITAGALVSAMSMPVFAADNLFENIICGDNTMASLNAEGIMTVSGTGSMEKYGLFDVSPSYPWEDDEVSKSIEHIVIEEGITGFDFVWAMPNLKTISLPNSLTEFDFWEFGALSDVQDKVFLSPYMNMPTYEEFLDGIFDGISQEQLDSFKSKYTCTFYGYKNTEPEVLADIGLKFHAMGDVDSNSDVNISDATCIIEVYAKSVAGLDVNTDADMDIDAADINRNGVIDINDATSALKYYARSLAGLDTDWEEILQK